MRDWIIAITTAALVFGSVSLWEVRQAKRTAQDTCPCNQPKTPLLKPKGAIGEAN